MVVGIHQALVTDFATGPDPIEPAGVRDRGELLESALGRPTTGLSGHLKYPTVQMSAAALLAAIIQDHPFANGNKRTAIVALLVFLDANSYVLTATETDLFDYTLALAGHDLGMPARFANHPDAETLHAAEWITRNSRALANHQRPVSWRDLRKILLDYDCQVENRAGNKIVIRRGSREAHFGARNEGDEIDKKTIAYIRRRLRLTENDGVDSEVFYYGAERISDFINKYRKTLIRLAQY